MDTRLTMEKTVRWMMGSLGFVFLFAGILSGPALGKTMGELSAEVQSLQEGQQKIQIQLEEIKKLLKAAGKGGRPPAVRDLKHVEISIAGDPVKGESHAKVVMIEFSDYQCPYCARHSTQVLPQLEKTYIETGKLQYVMRDFPLERIHRQAFQAAIAANCAGEQGKYWEMHDRLFAHSKNLEPMVDHAQAVGLDLTAFGQCVVSDTQAAEVRTDIQEAKTLGVRSTPSFVLAVVDEASGKILGVRFIKGAWAFERLSKEIDRVLASVETTHQP